MQTVEEEVGELDARYLWENLARHDDRGAAYLESRGLWSSVLEAGDMVRYTRSGAPAVSLRHLATGGVVNVVRRNLPADVAAGRPKTLGGRGMPTSGTLVGDVREIRYGVDVVVCEGVADSLAAVLCWPTAVICGAHGAGRLAEVAAEAAGRLVLEGAGRLLLVTDDDVTGVKAGVAACRAALAAGLEFGRDLIAVDLGKAHDLADAWRDGWRP